MQTLPATLQRLGLGCHLGEAATSHSTLVLEQLLDSAVTP